MKVLSNYELCLLILFCYKLPLLNIHFVNERRHKEHFNEWVKLHNSVNEYCNDTVISLTNPQGKENSILRPKMVLKVENYKLLNKFVDDYVNNLEQDTLKTYKCITNFETLEKEFWLSIDKTVNLKDYYVDDIKYLPIILWGLRKGQMSYKEILCTLFPREENISHISNIELRRMKYGQNDLNFGIIVDLYNYIKSRENKVLGSDENLKFEPKQQKLYEYIVGLVNKKQYSIDAYYLSKHLDYDYYDDDDRNALNTLVSDTNKIFRQINKIDNKKIKLLKKSSKTGLYSIWKDFKPDK